ncbi:glycosyltransferase family 39 protein [bacterium]|nr:glycosyltransferase family 39 protein [bacterium]
MNILSKSLIVIVIFFIFFFWATFGNILLPFNTFFPTFHIFFISFLVLFSVLFIKFDLPRTDINFGRSPFFILPAAAFILSLVVAFLFFQGIPHIQDSVNYLIMAENFAAGRLHSKMPEHYEFFQYAYMIPDGEKLYSVFLPGFSFFLVPFVILGIPVLVNPLLTALNVFLSGKIAEKLFDREIAVISMFFMLFSVFFIVMGGTWMAHSFCMTMTLAAVLAYIYMIEQKSVKYPIILGISLGWLALTRPQNTLFTGLPLILHYGYITFRKRDAKVFAEALKTGFFALLAFAPFLAFLLYYNSIYTGNPLIFKQDLFFNYSEPRSFCHRFGLGTGCPRSNWIELPLEGLTLSHAFLVSYRRLSSLIMNLFLHPLTLLLLPFGFVFTKSRKDFGRLFFLFSIFFVNFAGYFFFYFDGNVFGPRYLYETSFFLIIIIAYSFNMILDGVFVNSKASKLLKIFTFSLLCAGFSYQSIYIVPAIKSSYEKSFWNISADLKNALDEAGIKEGVVFTGPPTMYGSGYALMDHAHPENNKIIYVRDLGEKQNRRIMFEYPDKRYYWAPFKKMEHNTEPPEIIEIFAPVDTGEIHVELESKFYPLTGSPDYCNTFPERSYLDAYLEMEPPYNYLVKYQFLMFCRFVNIEQYYDFKQKVNKSSIYEIRVKGFQSPDMGNFDIFIDGKKAAQLDFHNATKKMTDISFSTHLEKGMHDFRLVPRELVSKYNYFMIDAVDFVPKELD